MGHLRPKAMGITSPVKIIANIFISFIGAGMLGLPYAFKEVSIFQANFTKGNMFSKLTENVVNSNYVASYLPLINIFFENKLLILYLNIMQFSACLLQL